MSHIETQTRPIASPVAVPPVLPDPEASAAGAIVQGAGSGELQSALRRLARQDLSLEGSQGRWARARVAGTRLAALWDTWIRRARSRRQLARLDERMLNDIGISRAEVFQERNKWFWNE